MKAEGKKKKKRRNSFFFIKYSLTNESYSLSWSMIYKKLNEIIIETKIGERKSTVTAMNSYLQFAFQAITIRKNNR